MKSARPAQRPSPSLHGQATTEMLLAFMALLIILQLLVFLANFGLAQQLDLSNAKARQLLAQKSLVLGVLCSDGEDGFLSLSTSHPASVKGSGHLLSNPSQTVSVMTLPEIEPNPNKRQNPSAGGTPYSCRKGEIPV